MHSTGAAGRAASNVDGDGGHRQGGNQCHVVLQRDEQQHKRDRAGREDAALAGHRAYALVALRSGELVEARAAPD